MEYIYCPLCSKAISSQAVIEACPHCYQPLNINEWKAERAKKTEKENAALKEQLYTKNKKKGLRTIGKTAIIQAYNKQKDTNGWTFYNEHDLVQRTLENRFNFLLIAYSLFLTAYFQSKYDINKFVILIIGFSLVILLSIGIHRTTNRFSILLDIVHSLEEDDVSPIIHKENKKRHKEAKSLRKNSIIGKVIPVIMCVSFGAGILFHIVKIVLKILKII